MDWEDLVQHSFKEHLPTEEDPSSDDTDGHTFETLVGDYADALEESAEHMAEVHEEEKSDQRWEAAVATHKAELGARYEEEANTRARELGYIDDDITVWEGNPLGPESGRLLLQDIWEADHSTKGQRRDDLRGHDGVPNVAEREQEARGGAGQVLQAMHKSGRRSGVLVQG